MAVGGLTEEGGREGSRGKRGREEGEREGGGRDKNILTTNERSTANHNYYTCSATASECTVV